MLALKLSLSNRQKILINVRKALASVMSMCSLIDDYTQIFNMIDKGDILSIQCKMSLRRPKYMRKVDFLSFILVDFMFQHSHHVSIALRLRCSFLRT
jgi:hypothetical protein